MQMVVETVEENPIDGKSVDAKSRFVCKITLDNNKTIVGPAAENRMSAKESACLKVLTEELGLEMPSEEDVCSRRAATILSPLYALQQLVLKQNGKNVADVVYSEPVDVSGGLGKPPLFKCTLTINGTENFEAVGQSKKASKSAAAECALLKLFNFNVSAENALEVLAKKKVKKEYDITFCHSICSFVREQYETICRVQACPITSHISAFVLVSPEGNREMVALGAGRNAIIDGRALSNVQGNVLIHLQSSVLARRSLLLYFLQQIEHFADPQSVVERCPMSNKFRLKPGYKVVFYSSFAPNLRAGFGAQKLSCYNMSDMGPQPTPEKLQTFDDIIERGQVFVMSIADKMLKWNVLGVQGALLSYILQPVFITHYFIGTPSIDKAITHAVLKRFGDSRKNELTVRSSREGVAPHGELYQNWVCGIGTIERLVPFTGCTVNGSPSRLCKAELFERWARVFSVVDVDKYKPNCSYSEAKKNEKVYQDALEEFIKQMAQKGLGTWQRKDSRIDNFKLASNDE